MDVVAAIKARKCIRAFQPRPVPKETLSEILSVAVRAPSALNAQPWSFIVLTGEPLEKLRQFQLGLLAAGAKINAGVPGQQPPRDSIYRKRQVEQAAQIYQLLGIPWEDKARRHEFDKGTFRAHNAPANIIITADSTLHEGCTLFNVALLAQTIMLAALDYGLGTCIHDIMFCNEVAKELGIPESKRIVIALAIGYPDTAAPVNKLQSTREPAETITTWFGF